MGSGRPHSGPSVGHQTKNFLAGAVSIGFDSNQDRKQFKKFTRDLAQQSTISETWEGYQDITLISPPCTMGNLHMYIPGVPIPRPFLICSLWHV
jgi:hypothetical protein